MPAAMRWLALVLAACSGGSSATDAPTSNGDSSFDPPPCSISPGKTYTMLEYGFHAPGVGFDLDGDGDIDNALGFLAPVANQVINDAIQSGFSRYLFDIEGWDAAPGNDPDVQMISFAGVDADQ